VEKNLLASGKEKTAGGKIDAWCRRTVVGAYLKNTKGTPSLYTCSLGKGK